MSSSPRSSVAQAIIVGHLFLTVPALTMALGAGAVTYAITHDSEIALIGVLIGILPGWLWWSLITPRWRRWALRRGAPADQLQKWGVITGLIWPKGWIFEKTEFKVSEEEDTPPASQ
jgi:hypothetical protein